LVDSQNINNLYKHINRKLRNSSSCLALYDQTGYGFYSDLDKAELFNAHFLSVNVDDNGNLPIFSRRAEANTKLDTVQLTAETIYKVIKKLKPMMTRPRKLLTVLGKAVGIRIRGSSCIVILVLFINW